MLDAAVAVVAVVAGGADGAELGGAVFVVVALAAGCGCAFGVVGGARRGADVAIVVGTVGG